MASLHVQELPAEDIHNLVLQGLEQERFNFISEMVPGLASLLSLPGVQDISTQQVLEALEAVVTATSSTFAHTVQDGFANAALLDAIVDNWLPVIRGYNR
jgi:allophanate hydrolase subunit 1